MTASFWLFHNSPARKGDFIEANSKTKNVEFPASFCATRWVENANVAKVGRSLIPNLKNYVDFVRKNKIEPKNTSYQNMVECLEDPMLEVRLAFF